MSKVMCTIRITHRTFGFVCLGISVVALALVVAEVGVAIGVGTFLSGVLATIGGGAAMLDTPGEA